ncbi:type II toxin-antitoxin system Phd/YefM family antitoxin [Microbacterium sp. WCS2018Hpa-9]|uniref:type II toxin-antitoxin system Phd/YefM family antitoxin n=1 Tax=Microbacterium sp. WCS2018Hpa-9 TaxID=3073635 RepID=UPI00288B6726|nr:type II toxin-antitoxin system Phd/YefM family antitoxin [Microbacterium sp. WCS2018Hpa-9]
MVTMSAREFNQSVARAQRLSESEPVIVTRRGEPAYVLLSIEDYDRMVASSPQRASRSFLDIVGPPPGVVFDDGDEFERILTDIRKNTPDRPPFEFD